MSPLRQALAGYLAVRRSLGYGLARPEKLLGQFNHLPGRCLGGDRDHPARAGVGDAARREPKLARAAAPSSPRVRLLAAHHRPSSRGAAGRPPPMEALPGHQMRQPNSPAWPSTWHGDLRDPHGSTWVYLRRAAPPGVECGRLERRTRPGRIADEDRPARRGRDRSPNCTNSMASRPTRLRPARRGGNGSSSQGGSCTWPILATAAACR